MFPWDLKIPLELIVTVLTIMVSRNIAQPCIGSNNGQWIENCKLEV